MKENAHPNENTTLAIATLSCAVPGMVPRVRGRPRFDPDRAEKDRALLSLVLTMASNPTDPDETMSRLLPDDLRGELVDMIDVGDDRVVVIPSAS